MVMTPLDWYINYPYFHCQQLGNENGENDQLGDMVLKFLGLASKEMYCTSYENYLSVLLELLFYFLFLLFPII